VHLEGDAYMLRHVGDPEYWIKRLVRGDQKWWYVGATHEYITNGSNGPVPHLDAITVHHHYDGSTRPEKFTRDLELLTEELEREPENARIVYYLANTLRDLGRAEEAIERYKQRADMGGWDEEVFEASLQAGMLADDVDLLFQAYNFRPTRAEPLYELAWRFRRRGMPHVAYLVAAQGIQITLPADTLFVRRWVYDWAMLFEFSIAAWWVGKRTASLQACDVLLMKPELPDSYREQVKRNRALCAPEDG
jgi:tetratricopeptide (TPR) repeat protein